MPQQRLRRRAQAKADASGAVTFAFDAVEANRAWVGSVSVLGGQASMVMVATVNALPWGGWTAEKPSGPIQGVEHEVLTVTGSGFSPGATYTAWWIGADQELAHAELFGPANPLSVSTTVSVNTTPLDFQHNDALVATELAVDFEDGTGVTWTLTDDPTNKRMKVAAAVSASPAATSLRVHYAAGGQNVNTSSPTLINFDTVDEDTAGGWSAVNHDYVVGVAGLYLVVLNLALAGAPAAGVAEALIYKNSAIAHEGPDRPLNGTPGPVIGAVATMRCAVNDVIWGSAFQNSGGAMSIAAADSPQNYLHIARLGG